MTRCREQERGEILPRRRLFAEKETRGNFCRIDATTTSNFSYTACLHDRHSN